MVRLLRHGPGVASPQTTCRLTSLALHIDGEDAVPGLNMVRGMPAGYRDFGVPRWGTIFAPLFIALGEFPATSQQ